MYVYKNLTVAEKNPQKVKTNFYSLCLPDFHLSTYQGTINSLKLSPEELSSGDPKELLCILMSSSKHSSVKKYQ